MHIPAEALVSIEGTGALVRLAIVLAALTGLAALVTRLAGLGYSRAQVTAAARAAVQLTIVGSLISAVLGSWWLTAGFALLMLVVASVTGGRRVSGGTLWWWAFLPVCTGALPVAFVLVGTRIVPLVPISVVPILGILTGGAMTAMTLAGRRVREALTRRHGEVEAALAIGLLDRDARLLIAGLVTLPGAFVGTLLGGATPLQAAAVQLVVLIALVAVAAISTALTLELVARGMLPGETVGPAH